MLQLQGDADGGSGGGGGGGVDDDADDDDDDDDDVMMMMMMMMRVHARVKLIYSRTLLIQCAHATHTVPCNLPETRCSSSLT